MPEGDHSERVEKFLPMMSVRGGGKGVLKKSAIQEFQTTAGLKWVQRFRLLMGYSCCGSHEEATPGTLPPPSRKEPLRPVLAQ